MHFKTATAIAALLTAATLTPAFALSLNLSGATSGAAHASSSGAHASANAGVSVGLDDALSLDASLGLGAVLDTSTSVATAGDVTASTTTDASAEAWGNVGLVVNLIESSDWTETSFSGVGNITAALFTVDDGANADARATLDAALGVYATDVAELQAALAANAELSGWLSAQDIALDSVIAANVTAEGTLALYTD